MGKGAGAADASLSELPFAAPQPIAERCDHLIDHIPMETDDNV